MIIIRVNTLFLLLFAQMVTISKSKGSRVVARLQNEEGLREEEIKRSGKGRERRMRKTTKARIMKR